MNAIKKAILEGCKTAEEVGAKLTEERNKGITLKKDEKYPPPITVEEVHFDSTMANVKHERDLKAKSEAAVKAAEGSKE